MTLLLRNPVDPKLFALRNNLKEFKKRYTELLKKIEEEKVRDLEIKKKYDTLIVAKKGMVHARDYTKLFKYSEMMERELKEAKEELRYMKLYRSVEQIKAVLRGAGLWHN